MINSNLWADERGSRDAGNRRTMRFWKSMDEFFRIRLQCDTAYFIMKSVAMPQK